MSVYGGPEINDSGLILHLDASNPKSYPGSGTTWFDLSGNGNHSTLSGFVSNPVFSYRYGGSFYFNGPTSKSHITCSTNNGLTSLSNFTIIMWGVLDDFSALSNARYYAFDSRVNAGSTSSGLGFDRKNVTYTSPFHFAEDATGYDETSGPTAFVKNNIYMFGLTRNGSAIQIIDTDSVTLISPSLVSNSLGTGNINFNGYRIGTYAGAGSGTGEYWWPGHICAVYVYNRVLTQAEITQHYICARSRFSTPAEVKAGLILDLDAGNTSSYSGSGTTWTDLSGSGYNATLYNGPTFNSGNGGSIVFDGSNDYAQTSNLTSVVSEKTLAAWCQLGSTTQSGGGLIGVMSTDGSIFDTIVYNETGQGWGFGSNNFYRTAWSGVSESSTSAWVYLAATYSNNLYKLYRNGVLILTTTAYSLYTFNIGINFIVGKRHSTVTGPLNAKIAKATVYNRALSALEIGTNFDALRGRYGL
jgi:hypothetical protein